MGYIDQNGLDALLMAAAQGYTFPLENLSVRDAPSYGTREAEYMARFQAQEREGERLQRDAQHKLMRLQEVRRLRNAIDAPSFKDFFKAFDPNHPCLAAILEMPWDADTDSLQAFLRVELEALARARDATGKKPEVGDIQGVYFCVGDGGATLHIAGARSFGQKDWATEADFWPTGTTQDVLHRVIHTFPDLLGAEEKALYQGTPDLQYSQAYQVEGMMYYFIAHALYHALKAMRAPLAFENATVAMGYSSGEELILGKFNDGYFQGDIHELYEEGDFFTTAS